MKFLSKNLLVSEKWRLTVLKTLVMLNRVSRSRSANGTGAEEKM